MMLTNPTNSDIANIVSIALKLDFEEVLENLDNDRVLSDEDIKYTRSEFVKVIENYETYYIDKYLSDKSGLIGIIADNDTFDWSVTRKVKNVEISDILVELFNGNGLVILDKIDGDRSEEEEQTEYTEAQIDELIFDYINWYICNHEND